jgi:hypothetical protein
MALKKHPRFRSHAVYVGGDARNIDLIVGKVYRIVRPRKLDQASDLRVIDESGEDYLYPADWFVSIDVPSKVKRALAGAN